MTGEKRLLSILESKPNVDMIFNTVVSGLESSNGELCAINIKNTESNEERHFELDGIFVAIGQAPENEAFRGISALNEYGYIIADESCLTDTAGVFVAGDCRTKRVRQVTTASADGAIAALAACRYIDGLI
jgi:thioredoxin reductase (NADPH)